MRTALLFAVIILFTPFVTMAQNACPGCSVNVPAGLPADTIYLPSLPDGEEGQPYNHDYSFRMPVTTTPVAAIDSTTPAGLPISKIEILDLTGLPPGMDWTPSQWVFEPATQSDGCIRICGIPETSDSFVLLVKIKVSVFFLSQEAEFPLRLYIAPEVSSTVGFDMSHFTGCGSVTTAFVNNIPSNGNSGISYEWNFGNGSTSVSENPDPVLFDVPGVYPISYKATIDTVGYLLQSVTILEVECVDQLGLGAPDLYLLINGPSGQNLFDSSPDVTNATLPLIFPVNLLLDDGNYTLEVWDEDSGLKGGDDLCGTISFNILSDGTLVSGGFKIILNIVHPVDIIESKDTVTVYEQPATPLLTAPNGLTKCIGNTTPLELISSSPVYNQWLLNGNPIDNATDSVWIATTSGIYAVEITTPDGCTAISDPVDVSIYPLPASPIYGNTNNLLTLLDTATLPDPYVLQWYNGNNPIPGENNIRYCVTQDGTYGLQVIDPNTNCTSFYASTVNFNPNFDCTVTTEETSLGSLQIRPNPANQWVNVLFEHSLSNAVLQVRSVTGALVLSQNIPDNSAQVTLDCSSLSQGVWLVEVRSAKGERFVGKLVVIP